MTRLLRRISEVFSPDDFRQSGFCPVLYSMHPTHRAGLWPQPLCHPPTGALPSCSRPGLSALYPQQSLEQAFQVVFSALSKCLAWQVRDVHGSSPHHAALIDCWPHAIAVGTDGLEVFCFVPFPADIGVLNAGVARWSTRAYLKPVSGLAPGSNHSCALT